MLSAQVSRKFHSRGAAIIMVAIAALYVALSGGLNNILPSAGDQGFGLPSAAHWEVGRWWSLGINIAANFAIMVLMVVINKAFNVLRAMTWLEVGLFAIMQGAVPRELTALNSGTTVCLAVVMCVYLIFSCYADHSRVRTIFLAFLILSLGTATQYCFALYIIVFWLMLAQMRIFTLRTFLASLLGLATVWIILLGFGLITPADLHLPHINGILGSLGRRPAIYLLAVTGLTTLILLVTFSLNVFKTIAYNARARAYNGALTVLSVVTALAIAADYDNLLAYLPLLNFCTAYQATHYFVNHRYDRQYIAILSIVGLYIALYIWRLSL